MPSDDRALEALPVVSPDSLPNTLADGQTLLVACPGRPAEFAFGLQALSHVVEADDTAVIVTTAESASRAIETYDYFAAHAADATDAADAADATDASDSADAADAADATDASDSADAHDANLEVVDTASEVQSLDAVYDEVPTIFTPAPGDLERLAVALSDLTDHPIAADTDRHLVVRSLTPILESTPTERVRAVLERLVGMRTNGGVCLLGIDYTAHDQATVDEIAALADGVLWLSQPTPGTVDVEYGQPVDRHRTR
ncbi:hypothetical protein G9C85_03255 [Halorubellus sp. JP-L1]|uniref:DUF7504 family protein n=1 Tax=Halorubellus sp. JP-L1 TaxID=2715753 RepID=UPI001409CE71|nr:hypothetical protein [Halorubellus sp. JP-L1]NHN40654.1 hypothetical protein [Halorubellus sp. JP-L1]